MFTSLKRSATLGAACLSIAAGILASAPAASASTGNWGWPQRSGGVHHGMNEFTTYGIQCLTSAGCTAATGMTLTLSPRAGAQIVNPNNVSFPFVESYTNTQVGSCVTNMFGVQCTLSSDVSLAYGQELVANAVGSGVAIYVPYMAEPGTAVGDISWYDPAGMTGNDPDTGTFSYVVAARF